jgi:tight adherence protein B
MTLFLVVSICGVLAYALASSVLERRDRKMALGRLAVKTQEKRESRRAARPPLIAESNPVQGRIAARLLERLRLKQAAAHLLDTAALKWGAAGLLHREIAMFLGGFLLVTLATGNQVPLLALAAGAALSFALLEYVRRKARGRIRSFEEQFPDCLEFISRSMRAGHAFSVAIEMVRREFSDPLAAEFRRAFEEQNLGQPLEIVLKKLAQRMPSMDVQFFVSAVLVQKRTGGNLAELLDKLATIIRERFKLRARVRALSAQGLMSGRILAAIPAAVGVMMFMANPQYARFFIDDPAGRELLAASVGLQLVGYLIIKKIVTIEV